MLGEIRVAVGISLARLHCRVRFSQIETEKAASNEMSPHSPLSLMSHLLSFLAIAVLPALSLGQGAAPDTLASLRHDYRPLLIFASSPDEEFRNQMHMFGKQARNLQERQILVVPILLHERTGEGAEWEGLVPQGSLGALSPAECGLARRRFHIGQDEFAVILLGKDGGEKLRSRTPVTMERLVKLIDSMPMRQKEARDGHS